MIKAALIDMDGILYDSMPMHAKAWKKLSSELGLNLNEEEFYSYEGMTGEATINLIAQRDLGKTFSHDESLELYKKKSAYFNNLGKASIMEGAKEVLAYLKEKGIICILVTGSGQASLLDRLQGDFEDAFSKEGLVTAYNVKRGKPYPDPYLKGAELAGCDVSECIAIDNAPLGVESAHRAGVLTIGVTTGPIKSEVLGDAGANIVVGSMKECLDCLKNLIP